MYVSKPILHLLARLTYDPTFLQIVVLKDDITADTEGYDRLCKAFVTDSVELLGLRGDFPFSDGPGSEQARVEEP